MQKLSKTWFIDFDGTVVKHNPDYKYVEDVLLPGVEEAFAKIPANDVVVITTARICGPGDDTGDKIRSFMTKHNLKCDRLMLNLGAGARILVNDTKPTGYVTAYAIRVRRDIGLQPGDMDTCQE